LLLEPLPICRERDLRTAPALGRHLTH
jgi:hypothetical protein